MTWQELVAKKQRQLQQDFPSQWRIPTDLVALYKKDGINLLESDVLDRVDFFTSEDASITRSYSAADLVKTIAAGNLSSVAVTTAFAKRAAIAQQLTSCLTETYIPQALERAKYLDDYLQRNGKVVGPLHGLPVSVKDSFKVKGLQHTIGFASFINHPTAEQNSALVDLLLDLGAVIYVKTNIPQTLMTADSENNVFGRVLNPNNIRLNAGGSSGGEGALISFRGSLLGIGTDIAGSVRIPALCCGVYGFKPTSDRVPYGGQQSPVKEGYPGVLPTAGPLAHSLNDLELFMSSVLGAKPWRCDSSAHALLWNQAAVSGSERKLTIGVLEPHPIYPLHPPIRRAMSTAVEALKAKGHRIVSLPHKPATDVAYANRLAWQYFTYPPPEDHIAASGEPTITSYAKGPSPMFTGPWPVDTKLETLEKVRLMNTARAEYSEAWRKSWVDNGLDAILAPSAQNTAVPHDTFAWPVYTCVWNLLDYPACVIPYGRASKELDPEPFSPEDNVQPKYDPDLVDGAPCSIQVVAPRFQDEECISAARIIDRDIR